jgi:lysophospholipase L1-like esterase
MNWFAAGVFGLFVWTSCGAQAPLQGAAETRWVGSWACSQQTPEPQNNQPGTDASLLRDVTIRQVVHLSIGGSALRLHLSNAFGAKPFTLDSVQVVRSVSASSSEISPGTSMPVTFDGAGSVTIPAGAELISDPVQMTVAPLTDLAVSFHMDSAPDRQTWHPGSRADSFLLHGRHTSDARLAEAVEAEHWFQISAVDVLAPANARAIVVLGDSITDGHGSTTNHNDRWPDVLAQRLQGSTAERAVSVLNEGIGGNHLLTDGLGANALARMDRDVFAEAGVKYVFVLEGINDIGMLALEPHASPEEHRLLVKRMIAAYKQIVLRAHDRGLKVIGGTITPFVGSDYYHPAAENEADRQQVNAWIRMPGHFDAVVDFDATVRDPADSSRMLPAVDSGDHLHPGPRGYRMMGDSVPLTLFQ